MTNQIKGEILYSGASNIFTPWMPVRGDIGTFGVEVLQRNGTGLKWAVETRKLDEPPASAILIVAETTFSPTSFPDTVVTLSSGNDALELVRYRFATDASANTTDFVVFRALQPSWQVDR